MNRRINCPSESEENGIALSNGQRIMIAGSLIDEYDNGNLHAEGSGHDGRMHGNGADEHGYLIVTRLESDGVTLRIREEEGYPLWHGTGWHYFSPEWANSSVQTLSGEVEKTQRRKHRRFLDKCYEVLMRSGGQSYALNVSPHWQVNHMGLKLRNGDQIRVRGSMVAGDQGRGMVAQGIEGDGDRWPARDSKSQAKWVKGAK